MHISQTMVAVVTRVIIDNQLKKLLCHIAMYGYVPVNFFLTFTIKRGEYEHHVAFEHNFISRRFFHLFFCCEYICMFFCIVHYMSKIIF